MSDQLIKKESRVNPKVLRIQSTVIERPVTDSATTVDNVAETYAKFLKIAQESMNASQSDIQTLQNSKIILSSLLRTRKASTTKLQNDGNNKQQGSEKKVDSRINTSKDQFVTDNQSKNISKNLPSPTSQAQNKSENLLDLPAQAQITLGNSPNPPPQAQNTLGESL